MSVSEREMHNKNFNTRGQRINGSERRLTCLQCAVILSIPIGSLYVGYLIGAHFMPDRHDFGDYDAVAVPLRLNYSWYNTHNLTIRLLGGLGNQMFQYASMYGVARANGLRPRFVPPGSVLAATFGRLKAPVAAETGFKSGADWRRFRESASAKFDSRAFNLNFMAHIEMLGFFQSWHYFDHVRGDVRAQLAFRSGGDAVDRFLRRAERDARAKSSAKPGAAEARTQFVGVHVRRRDMLGATQRDAGYTTATPQYLAVAMKYFADKYRTAVVFVVASDDVPWCREHIAAADNVVYSPFAANEPGRDLHLLARCNHSVITVGTFGWWAATLAGGEVTYFKDFPRPQSALARAFRPADYYPAYWIPV